MQKASQSRYIYIWEILVRYSFFGILKNFIIGRGKSAGKKILRWKRTFIKYWFKSYNVELKPYTFIHLSLFEVSS